MPYLNAFGNVYKNAVFNSEQEKESIIMRME